MATSQARHELLRARARRFTRALRRVEGGNAAGGAPGTAAGAARLLDAAWVSTRRVRELLPVLRADADAVRKLSARLRKLGRRLASARDLGAVVQLLEAAVTSEQRGRQSAGRVRADVQKLFERARGHIARRKTAHEVDRLSAKLDVLAQRVTGASRPQTSLRDLRWAVNARLARRAASLKEAIAAAGSVYLAERLHRVRVALMKLRFGAELGVDVAAGATAADFRAIVRLQTLLDRLHQTQLLIDRTRFVQSGLATPDLKAWRDLDDQVTMLERRCRAIHARYVRDREALVELCDRLTSHVPAAGVRAAGVRAAGDSKGARGARRKVS